MLQLTDVNMVYPDGTQALNRVSFRVAKGEFLAVIGLSGSGKTTLLKCLNRTVAPSCGRIMFQGKNLVDMEADDLRQSRRGIAVVFQQLNLIKRYTALTNVLTGALGGVGLLRPILGLWPSHLRDRALEKLEIVGIRDKAFSRVDMLSGGQQQRVAIARCLMQEPDLILADEPVASLDPMTSLVVMDYLRTINEDFGITIVCTLHSMELAKKYASSIIAMKGGSVIFDGGRQEFTTGCQEMVYSHG